jgi:histidine triad (HIT) family protein
MIARWLYRFFKTRAGAKLIRFLFSRFSSLLPFKRLGENTSWLAFHHPIPSYSRHFLIVPKKNLHNVLDLADMNGRITQELFQLVKQLILEYNLEENYRLITNGGRAQEVDFLHFHLVSEGDFQHKH